MNKTTTTNFGYEQVSPNEKTERVKGVFDSVADNYDLMNDVMSLGLHRWWKRVAITRCALSSGQKVLDLAGGTGDLSLLLAKAVGSTGQVILSDINFAMLELGQKKLLDHGILKPVTILQANAEHLPLPSHYFDCVTMAFGLRNVTDKELALKEIYRVLQPGGRAIILEFSEPTLKPLKPIYDLYSFKVLPLLGKWIAKDSASYQYLAESIRKHPNQNALKKLMIKSGFDQCEVENLNAGIVAIHCGFKF